MDVGRGIGGKGWFWVLGRSSFLIVRPAFRKICVLSIGYGEFVLVYGVCDRSLCCASRSDVVISFPTFMMAIFILTAMIFDGQGIDGLGGVQ